MTQLQVYTTLQAEPHILWSGNFDLAYDFANNIAEHGFFYKENKIHPCSIITIKIENKLIVKSKGDSHP